LPAHNKVFDPGIDEEPDEETELVLDAMGAFVRAQVNRLLSMREGEFQAGGVSVSVFKVFFDTGALHKSYISADLVETSVITGFRIYYKTAKMINAVP